MKISEFARTYGINKETIRYYTDLGLLIPEKIGNYYDYNTQCIEDMDKIMLLKNYEFSLNEILKILSFVRLVGVNEEDVQENFQYIIKNKKQELIDKKIKLEEKIKDIDKLSMRFKVGSIDNKYKMGINIKFINYLACPECGQELELVNSRITGETIIQGTMRCYCGYEGLIKDGIIICENLEDYGEKPHYLIESDLSNIEPELISMLKKTSNYIYTKVCEETLINKVVLDLDGDINLISSKLINLISENTIYIITGHSFEDVKHKQFLLSNSVNVKNIIFMAGIEKMPIKHSSIDLIIDGYATSFRLLNKNYGYMECCSYYFKKNCKYIGAYFGYKKDVVSLRNIRERSRKYFLEDNLIKYFQLRGFAIKDHKEWKGIKNTGHALAFHNHKNELYLWAWSAIKNS